MRLALLVLVGGCVDASGGRSGDGRLDPVATDDTAAAEDSGLPDTDTAAPDDDTAAPIDPCAGPGDPDRSLGFADILGRLQVQHCLSEDDQDAAIAYVDVFFEEQLVWCDAVYRLSSPDGLSFSGTPELVRENASVSDVVLTPDGAHVLLYNDLRPGLFARAIREDPDLFWRQGLVGIGGLGMSLDRGEGFVEAPLDLHLAGLSLVVDPDISLRPSGTYRIVTFQVPFVELDGEQWDPLQTGKPHDFFRAVSPLFGSFPTPTHVLAGETGEQGAADPTVLDVPDGEILFLGDFTRPLVGWYAPHGQYPPDGTPPDVDAGLPAAAPNAVPDPDGGYRLYFVDHASMKVWLATSDDGRAWTPAGRATDLSDVNSPSVVRDGEGTWWLYFNRREAECVEGVGFAP